MAVGVFPFLFPCYFARLQLSLREAANGKWHGSEPEKRIRMAVLMQKNRRNVGDMEYILYLRSRKPKTIMMYDSHDERQP